jgi:hypothetical protein
MKQKAFIILVKDKTPTECQKEFDAALLQGSFISLTIAPDCSFMVLIVIVSGKI